MAQQQYRSPHAVELSTLNGFSFALTLDERDRDVDVPARGLGTGARLVRFIDEGLRSCGIDARQIYVETCLEQIGLARLSKVDFRIDLMIFGKSNLPLGCRDTDRADKAGRPPGCEELLRIRATPPYSRNGTA